MFYLPQSVAMRIHLAINKAGEASDGWDEDFKLKPARHVTDIEVLRAA